MKGVSLDAKSCIIGVAAGLVPGLAAGAAGGLLYARRRIQAAFDARLDQEVGAVKADYNRRLKAYLGETGSPYVGINIPTAASQAGDGNDGTSAVGAAVEGSAGVGTGGRLQPDDEILPGDIGGRTPYHQIARRDGTNNASGSPIAGRTIRSADLTRASIGVHHGEHTEASGQGDGEHGSFHEDSGDGQDAAAGNGEDAAVHNVFDDESQGPAPVPYGISAGEFAETPEGYQVLSMTFYAEDNVLVNDSDDQPIDNVEQIAGPLTVAGFGGISGQEDTRYVRNERMEFDIDIGLVRGSYVHDKLGYGKP